MPFRFERSSLLPAFAWLAAACSSPAGDEGGAQEGTGASAGEPVGGAQGNEGAQAQRTEGSGGATGQVGEGSGGAATQGGGGNAGDGAAGGSAGADGAQGAAASSAGGAGGNHGGGGGGAAGGAGTGGGFAHPGVLLGKAQLDFVKANVAAKAEPWATAFSRVQGSHYASLTYAPHPAKVLTRSTDAATNLQEDYLAAYADALVWYYLGDARYADRAVAIMNAWSSTLTSIETSSSQLDAAWASETFTRAAEIIRHTYEPAAGHAAFDATAFAAMLTKLFLPQLDPTSNGATYSNGNWELSMADGTINIGIFTDDKTVFERGVAMWRARVPAYIYEPSDGAVPVYPPGGHYDSAALVTCFWATGGLHEASCNLPEGFGFSSGMAQESCRDMSHVILGYEAMVNAAESARLQGVDLYGEQKQRLVDGYEFAARHDLEALAAPNSDKTAGAVSGKVCGGSFNYGGTGYTIGWEIAYNAYAGRLGVAMPSTQKMVAKLRPTSAALDAAWETLTNAGVP